MKKENKKISTKRYLIISIAVAFIALSLTACSQKKSIYDNQNTPVKNADETTSEDTQKNYSLEPLMECVGCVDGKTWNNKTCCTKNFETDCSKKNGVVRWVDLHPAYNGQFYGCFQKAPDAGKSCASEKDCLSGWCDLASAISSNKCELINKQLSGGKNSFSNEEYFIATYSCSTDKPGKCLEAVDNQKNPGGSYHYFKMQEKNMVEILGSGPIY